MKDLDHKNLEPKGKKGIFVGYSKLHSDGTYSILMEDTNRIVHSRHVAFMEHQLYPNFDRNFNQDHASDIVHQLNPDSESHLQPEQIKNATLTTAPTPVISKIDDSTNDRNGRFNNFNMFVTAKLFIFRTRKHG